MYGCYEEISTQQLITFYQRLLDSKKILTDGPAHNRLKELKVKQLKDRFHRFVDYKKICANSIGLDN